MGTLLGYGFMFLFLLLNFFFEFSFPSLRFCVPFSPDRVFNEVVTRAFLCLSHKTPFWFRLARMSPDLSPERSFLARYGSSLACQLNSFWALLSEKELLWLLLGKQDLGSGRVTSSRFRDSLFAERGPPPPNSL